MKYLDLTGLSQFWTKVKEWVNGQITSATNTLKSSLKLSDITDVTATVDEVNYLSGLKSNAQAQLDLLAPKASPEFTGVPTAPTATSGTNTQQVATTAFVKSAVDTAVAGVKSDLASALTYKGSKDTYAELPKSDNQKGDVWNVVGANGTTPAGTNYAWDGENWDPLGGTVDLSAFLTEDNFESISQTDINGLFP